MSTARTWGIEAGYLDAADVWRDAPAATVEALLDAMGATPGSAPPESPVLIARMGEPVDLGDAVEVVLEQGGSERVDGALPPELPPGYHRLVGHDGSERDLILSPGSCFLPQRFRTWGWAVQLYSARSRASWGVGDLGDLRGIGRWARGKGAGMLLLNPLHAPKPGPQQPSPYFPSSRTWRNPLYVRIEDVPGSDAAAVNLEDLAASGRALNSSGRIDRNAVYELKMKALGEIWARRETSPGFDRFRRRQGSSLTDFATFMTLVERHGTGPRGWPSDFEDPRDPAVTKFRVDNEDRVLFHEWVQWLLEEQLVEAGSEIGLVHDLAIGVDPDGADAWLWGHVFAPGVKVGAPPDLFNSRGQDWGLPPFDPWKLRRAGYRPFIETLRANMTGGAGLRIDHVMGLFRLYWIPDGSGPADGTYVRYPHRDLLDILALESHRAEAYVIGEDLGTVETLVRDEMTERDMLSYRIMWFEDALPSQYPERALAAVTNHDLPTVAGCWSGRDLEEQRDLGLEPNEKAELNVRERFAAQTKLPPNASVDQAVKAAYGLLAQAPSAIVVATLEDALGVELRPNQPGTTDERPNWSMALPVPLEELENQRLVRAVARTLARGRGTRSGGVGSSPLDVTHDYVALREVTLHYAEMGSGPLVLMLHGFPDFWYSWRHQMPYLAARGFRTVAIDMRGYNLSDKPSGVGAYRIQKLVEDVRQLVEELGDGPAHVIGHDWGAVVAWYFAMSHPVLLDRLAILNGPHPHRFVTGMRPNQMMRSWYMAFFQLPLLPERFLSQNDYAMLRKLFLYDPADPDAFSDDDIEKYVEAARHSGDLRYPINYYRALVRPNPLPALRWRPIERPVQILWGEGDRFLEPSLAEPDRRWVPEYRIHRLPKSSHWVQHDEPDEVNRVLAAFLED